MLDPYRFFYYFFFNLDETGKKKRRSNDSMIFDNEIFTRIDNRGEKLV